MRSSKDAQGGGGGGDKELGLALFEDLKEYAELLKPEPRASFLQHSFTK